MGLNDQPRIRLATLPTPLQFAERLSRELSGPRIWIKRDDLTGLAFGGNKTRKLEFLVADALQQGATHLITEGGTQSNHCRQTAAAARVAGLEAVLVLNASAAEPPVQGNLLLDRLLGATINLVMPGWSRRAAMDEVAIDLRNTGANPYIIPSGGSNGVGAVGYVAAMLELNYQLFERGIAPRRLYFASGGGGTHAGIALGGALYGSDYLIDAIMIEDTADEGIDRTWQVIEWTVERLNVPNPVRKSDLFADGSHVGPGYGIATPACLEAIALLARTEGILLDPVYTGKAFAGLLHDIRAGLFSASDDVVFLHTGGTPALFAMTDVVAPILGT